jgi:hypothetical protein
MGEESQNAEESHGQTVGSTPLGGHSHHRPRHRALLLLYLAVFVSPMAMPMIGQLVALAVVVFRSSPRG